LLHTHPVIYELLAISVDLGELVGDQLGELRCEPLTGDRGVRESVGHHVVVQRVAAVGRVAHAVEALALIIGDERAGAIGLTWGFDPVGTETKNSINSLFMDSMDKLNYP
jgi:hypothetical protein